MLPFSYEDRCPAFAATAGYGATNEEPLIAKQLLKGKTINNGLAIASAGEMTFRTFLPKTQGSLVLIDHSYKSLRAFCIKALLLATLGADATRKLLIAEKQAGWTDAINKVDEFLPEPMKSAKFGGFDVFTAEAANIRREWFYMDLKDLQKTVKNLGKIKLIHGDLSDVADLGPYDFLYISNALEHQGRLMDPTTKNNYPNVQKLTGMLTPTATILWAIAQGQTYGTNAKGTAEWGQKTKIYGYRTSWYYVLSKLTPKAKETPCLSPKASQS